MQVRQYCQLKHCTVGLTLLAIFRCTFMYLLKGHGGQNSKVDAIDVRKQRDTFGWISIKEIMCAPSPVGASTTPEGYQRAQSPEDLP